MKRQLSLSTAILSVVCIHLVVVLVTVFYVARPAHAAPTNFNTTATAYTGDKHSLKWEANGDTTLFISISTGGSEKDRRGFTFTSGGRLLDSRGVDIGAVPATFATKLASLATVIDTAVGTICGAGKCDP